MWRFFSPTKSVDLMWTITLSKYVNLVIKIIVWTYTVIMCCLSNYCLSNLFGFQGNLPDFGIVHPTGI